MSPTAIVPLSSLNKHESKQPPLGSSSLSVSVRVTVNFFTGVIHFAMIAAVLSFALLHQFIRKSPQLSTDFENIGSGMLGYFPVVEVMCYVAIACHGGVLLCAVPILWQHRHAPKLSTSIKALIRSSTIQELNRQPRWRRMSDTFVALYSAYPTEIAQARLLFEIGLQTFQADKMSGFVSSVWLNRLLVFVIVVNCWFTPIIYWTMRRQSELTRRIVRLTLDTMLDVIYCLGIPAMIMYPYWRDFDRTVHRFPFDFYVRDAWGLVMLADFRQVFVSSATDFISKTCPWFFMCYRLHSLRQVVSRKPSESPGSMTRTRWFRVLNFTQVVCGCTVLVLHLHTAWIATSTAAHGCLVEVRPWFTSSHTCTVIEVSCSQRQIAGTKADVSTALSEFTPGRIQGLVISHCSHFEMPPAFLSFNGLSVMKIYNTTIAEWERDTAITASHHPNFQKFMAIETNATSVPDGLLSPQMPTTFTDVKFVGSNLTAIPTAAAKAWGSVKYVTLELNFAMLEFPSALAAIPGLIFVALPSNAIRSIPSDQVQDASIWILHIANNPLSTLPERLGRPGSMVRLNIQWTNISRLPATWMATRHDLSQGLLTIDAAFSPLCSDPHAREFADNSDASGFSLGRFSILCVDAGANLPNVTYPLDTERSWREANRNPL